MPGDNSKNNPDQEAPAASSSRVEETAGLLTAGLDSMTPAIAQRLAATAAQLAELIDVINNDEMKNLLSSTARAAESLERSIGAIKTLEESGALATLVEIGDLADAVKQSLTTSLVTRSLSPVLSLVLTGDQILEVVRKSAREAEKDTRKLGLIALLRELQDPQVQESLRFILALSRHLPDLLETL